MPLTVPVGVFIWQPEIKKQLKTVVAGMARDAAMQHEDPPNADEIRDKQRDMRLTAFFSCLHTQEASGEPIDKNCHIEIQKMRNFLRWRDGAKERDLDIMSEALHRNQTFAEVDKEEREVDKEDIDTSGDRGDGERDMDFAEQLEETAEREFTRDKERGGYRYDDTVDEGDEVDQDFEGFQVGPALTVASGRTVGNGNGLIHISADDLDLAGGLGAGTSGMSEKDLRFIHQLETEEEEEVKLPMWVFGTFAAAFVGLCAVVLLLVRRKVEHNTYSTPVTVDNL